MSRQSYLSSTTQVFKHITNHNSSNLANPDEDWTKISDRAERRRVQNRIAQRKFRKKLQRRLEDLESRVESSSVSRYSPRTPAERPNQSRSGGTCQHYKNIPNARQQQQCSGLLPRRNMLAMQSEDDRTFANSLQREGSEAPTLPHFGYYTRPGVKDDIYPLHAQSYQTISSSGDQTQGDSSYLSPVFDTDFLDPVKWNDQTPFDTTRQALSSADVHNYRNYRYNSGVK